MARRRTRRRRRTYARRAPVRRRRTTRRRRRNPSYAAPRRTYRRRRNPGPHARRRRNYRRRRNPSRVAFGTALRKAVGPYLAGVLTAGGTAMFDKHTARFPIGRELAKIAGVVLIAGTVGRRERNRDVASAMIGALGATQGYKWALRLTGGVMAASPEEAIEQGQLPANQKNGMGVLLTEGMGVLLNGVPHTGEAINSYQTAMSNTAGPFGWVDDEAEDY